MSEQRDLDGRTRRALDLAIARRQVSQKSYRAVLAGEITLQQAKELGRDRGPGDTGRGQDGHGRARTGQGSVSAGGGQDSSDTPPQPVSRLSKDDTTQECWCGCKELTSPNRKWRPGHDQRGKGIIRRAVKEGKVEGLSDRLRDYGAERGLL